MAKTNIEEKLLSADKNLEKAFEDKLEAEIAAAKEKKEELKIVDSSKVPKELLFSTKAVYKVFNRNNKTETFVNGEQAEAMIKYTNDYVVKFDHIILG